VSESPSGSGETAVGRQLLAQAQAISQLRRDVDQFRSDLADAIADTATRIESLEEAAQALPDGKRAMAWCWRYLGPQGSESLWRELNDWVGSIRSRYPLARRIPECWADHPEAVEELTALWLAWNAAYTERATPLTGAIDWHDRWLPGVLHRLEHGAFALDCDRGHQIRPASAYADPVETDASFRTSKPNGSALPALGVGLSTCQDRGDTRSPSPPNAPEAD
jgi:hypothetical protein